jgi:hypothetical protein
MPLVEFIREVLPHAYWSAGFIALLLVVMGTSIVLYTFSRSGAWVCSFIAAALYLVPFLFFMR